MSDTFRKDYKVLSPGASELVRECKEQAEILETFFKNIQSREMSLAMTNLEQALMWATKAIVLKDEELNHDK